MPDFIHIHPEDNVAVALHAIPAGALDESAQDLMALVQEIASGKQTKTEEKGYREISIFKDGVML